MTERMVSVPVEPTEAMLNAWHKAVADGIFGSNGDDGKSHDEYMRDAYRAMLTAAPVREEGGAIVRWRGDGIPYTCPYPSIGVRGSPYGYNIDPGAGSGMDRLQRNWPDRAQVRDMRKRDGEITPLFPSYALATREEAPAEAGEGETLRVLLDNLVIAQSLSKELRERATDEARSYLYNLRAQPQARQEAQPVAHVVRKGLSTGSLYYTRHGQEADLLDGTPLYTTPPAPEAEKLLNALRDHSWDLRCFDVPTGGDDADIGWRVVGHWQAEPRERTIAEVFSDDPAEAIRQALAALQQEGR